MLSRGGFPSLWPSVQPIDNTVSGTVKIYVLSSSSQSDPGANGSAGHKSLV